MKLVASRIVGVCLRRSLACSRRCLRASAIRRVRRMASIRAAVASSSAVSRSRLALASSSHGASSRLLYRPRHTRWIPIAAASAATLSRAAWSARARAATIRPQKPRQATWMRTDAQTNHLCRRRRAASCLASQPRARRWISSDAAWSATNSTLITRPRFVVRHRRWIMRTARFACLPYRPSNLPHIHPDLGCMHDTATPAAAGPALWGRAASGLPTVGFDHVPSAGSASSAPASCATAGWRRRRERARGRTGSSAPAASDGSGGGGGRLTPAVAGRRRTSSVAWPVSKKLSRGALSATRVVPEIPPDSPAFRRRSTCDSATRSRVHGRSQRRAASFPCTHAHSAFACCSSTGCGSVGRRAAPTCGSVPPAAVAAPGRTPCSSRAFASASRPSIAQPRAGCSSGTRPRPAISIRGAPSQRRRIIAQPSAPGCAEPIGNGLLGVSLF